MQQPSLAPYFMLLMILVTVLIMNLVTGAIVEAAMTTSRENNADLRNAIRAHASEFLPTLRQVFKQLDTSRDGFIKLDIFETRGVHEFEYLKLPPALKKILQPTMLRDVFEVMDHDGDGKVSIDDFVDGVFGLAFSPVPLETTQTLALL